MIAMDGKENEQVFFARRFKAVRESLGLDIKTIAKKSGLARNNLYRYERGEFTPASVSVWNLLAIGHGMELDEYMDALFGKKNIQPDDFKRLEDRVAKMESVMKKCPLDDSS